MFLRVSDGAVDLFKQEPVAIDALLSGFAEAEGGACVTQVTMFDERTAGRSSEAVYRAVALQHDSSARRISSKPASFLTRQERVGRPVRVSTAS